MLSRSPSRYEKATWLSSVSPVLRNTHTPYFSHVSQLCLAAVAAACLTLAMAAMISCKHSALIAQIVKVDASDLGPEGGM